MPQSESVIVVGVQDLLEPLDTGTVAILVTNSNFLMISYTGLKEEDALGKPF